MNDNRELLVLTADADALAVMKSVLRRHQAIRIRPITFHVDRHPLKDSGMFRDGPELARLYKGRYEKLILMWDYHGSGDELRRSPQESEEIVHERLCHVSWKDRSKCIIIVPELEEWLWHNEASIWSHINISDRDLGNWIENFAATKSKSVDQIKSEEPKELFEYIFIEKAKITISPRDFEKIAERASLNAWQESTSFRTLVEILREWFPLT
jgi:hypothetical protein